MWSKKVAEINNPPMKKGQVMYVTDNLDGGYDETYIKIAPKDGHFNDFEYGLPFGVTKEVVEIVPEQMITAQRNMNTYWNGVIPNTGITEVNKEYIVVINETTYKCVTFDGGSGVICIGDNSLIDYPFFLSCMGTSSLWLKELGQTFNFAIYEEQEIVKPIDISYIPIEELKVALGLNN